jgi:hypothetical protein
MSVRSALSFVLALLLGGTALVGCKSKEITAPATVADESDAALKARYHADEAFTLAQPDGTYRVLVFKLPKVNDADSDYRVVFYRGKATPSRVTARRRTSWTSSVRG